MAKKKHSKWYYFSYLFLLIFLFTGCRRDSPQVVIITLTAVPTDANTPAIDPTIASVLIQAALTMMMEATE